MTSRERRFWAKKTYVAMTQTPKVPGRLTRRITAMAFLGAQLGVTFGCQDPNPEEEILSSRVPAESGVDYALRFDGVDDYASLGTARFPLPTSDQCVSLWVRLREVGTRQALLTLRRDDSGDELGISEAGLFTLWRIWSPEVLAAASEPLSAGDWHHLAYVRSEGEHRLYVDGRLQSRSTTGSDNHSPTTGFIGTFDGKQRFFDGDLDELRIWAIARSASDIEAEFGGGGAKSDPDLVGYYSFNESPLAAQGGAATSRAYDRSGNGNHATLGDGVADFSPTRIAGIAR